VAAPQSNVGAWGIGGVASLSRTKHCRRGVGGLNNQPIDGRMGRTATMRAATKRVRDPWAMAMAMAMSVAGDEEGDGDGDEGGGRQRG
jgi:hypothetical protein